MFLAKGRAGRRNEKNETYNLSTFHSTERRFNSKPRGGFAQQEGGKLRKGTVKRVVRKKKTRRKLGIDGVLERGISTLGRLKLLKTIASQEVVPFSESKAGMNGERKEKVTT